MFIADDLVAIMRPFLPIGFMFLVLETASAANENCSDISIQPITLNGSPNLLQTGILSSIEFSITYNCSNTTNITISWMDLQDNPITNGTMSRTNPLVTYNSSDVIVLNWTGFLTTGITLMATEIQASKLIVNVTNDDSEILIYKEVDIATNCTSGTTNAAVTWPNQTLEYSYKEEVVLQCRIQTSCRGQNDTTGNKKMQCGVTGSWIETEMCMKKDYAVTITLGDARTYDVPIDKGVTLSCQNYTGYTVNMTAYDGASITNGTLVINKTSFPDHHNEMIICRWTNDSNDTLVGNIKLNVLSIPREQQQKVVETPIIGEKTQLVVPFWANPPVSISDISVTHGTEIQFFDFYFKSNGITQEVLLYFSKVTPSNYGDYSILISGVDEFCNSKNSTLHASLKQPAIKLHIGYVISIVLGAVLFLVLVIIAVSLIKKRCCGDGHSKERIANDIQLTPNKICEPVVDESSHRYNNQRFQHDDDEFEPDDYETIDAPVDSRPPMPVPPPPRRANYETPNQRERPPASPVPQRYQQHNVPPARGGLPPPRGVVPPMRNVRPPPPVSRSPDQGRSQTNAAYPHGSHTQYNPRSMTLPQQRGYENPMNNNRRR